MKTSVISHRTGTKYIKIYEDFVTICTYLTEVNGKMVERSNTCAAALLGYYEHLHNGRNNTENTNFELSLSNAYLECALFGNYSAKTIREANLLLEELGYITVKRPTKSGVFSKERNKILLNVGAVNTALELAAICKFTPVISISLGNIAQRRKDVLSNITQREEDGKKDVATLGNITYGVLGNITHNNNDNKEYIIKDNLNTIEREHAPEEKDIIIYPLKDKKLEEVAGGAGGGELLSNSEQPQAPQTYEELKAELWRKSETGTKLATYLRNLELPLLNEKSKIVFEKVFDKWLAYQISEKSKLNICDGTIESAINLVHSEHKKKVSIAGLLNNWTCTTWSKQEAQKYMAELNRPAGTRKTALEELQECDFENLPAF